ncbi:putative protein kinase [Aspergillus homomorphus CBS 101889]|uniref:Kinase-like protein n=1 Tax=Aspergillus homomorphus (strain CBS 101889) TaxID=1450537 RepID=A0A395HX14_ASPHC|nr:kinase-like protein [Aspergillus homomorphus CBS 101889]RAL12337.1 kinase-like protein [Aspergillus homomorphus CBS 101889]
MNPFNRLGRFIRRQSSPLQIVRNLPRDPILDFAIKIEDEKMPAYERGLYYPVTPGEVIQSQYQVLSKLGFGANSTVWLHHHRYIALKIYTSSSSEVNNEARVLKHLSEVQTDHPGSACVRRMLAEFEITSSRGRRHQCIVHEPLTLLKGALQQLLLALDSLHSEAHMIHTGSSKDDSIFREWATEEQHDPSPRKSTGDDYTVYQSRRYRRRKGWHTSFGMPLLAAFGEARIGDTHRGLIQPDLYRAPEVVLGMKWGSKVDIWNVGIWDLFEEHHLFDGRGPDGKHSDAQLLAEMVALLGPPPLAFLEKSPRSREYWDAQGNRIGAVNVPRASLEDSEEYLEGENKELFMQFVRKMLQWDPEARLSARELLMDPWLNKP